ncbi:MAG: methyl-accepting chemotaxis protein [Geovibrio sp.]|nr:methyl-accepting chemotaxis protein [Geovibrio sp.]
MRKLAERTQKATSEISDLVMGTQSEMDNVTKSMEGVTGQVNTGLESSKQIAVVLKDIEEGVSPASVYGGEHINSHSADGGNQRTDTAGYRLSGHCLHRG